MVLPAEVIPDGVLVIDAGRIVAIESGTADERLPGWLVPGFVDTHSHGGAGADFSDLDAAPARRAIALHRGHGSTSIIGSTVTQTPEVLREQIGAMADLCDEGELVGIHLEGPCLAMNRRGAHASELLRDPATDMLAPLLAAGRGHVRMMTLAPERAGGLEAVRYLSEHGVIAAFGHSDADADTAKAAIADGATVATHLFNAMRPIRHREPGPIPTLLTDERILVELICDGIHVHPDVLRLAIRAAGPDRVALVTDAMSATGCADGRYALGALAVDVTGGVARVVRDDGEPGSLAGSTLTMDAAFERLVGFGLPIADVARMAATTPARHHGLSEVGELAAGRRADACLVDDDGRLQRVLYGGQWLDSAAVAPAAGTGHSG